MLIFCVLQFGKYLWTTQVEAVDLDQSENGEVKYRLQKQNPSPRNSKMLTSFHIDEKTGLITATANIQSGEVTLFVEASDSPKNPSETRTSLSVVLIK